MTAIPAEQLLEVTEQFDGREERDMDPSIVRTVYFNMYSITQQLILDSLLKQ